MVTFESAFNGTFLTLFISFLQKAKMKLFSNLIGFLIAENKARRPNVILINCDDFGIGDFQIYNKAAKVPTPNIDRLGKEGIKFLDGHSASSRCAPSRYGLMTGRYNMEDNEYRQILPGEPHLAEMFKKSGSGSKLMTRK